MDSTVVGLLAVVVLVLANGFFVATEFAIVAVRRSRLEQLVAEGKSSALAASQVVGHLDIYIAACQLGITMASLALGWVGEPAFAHLVEPPLELLIGQFAPAASHAVAVGVSFALITALHIVIGELAPKGLALQKPEETALVVARPLRLFERVFRLPIRVLNNVGNGVLRLFGLEPASGHEMVHSVEELRLLVRGMERAVVDAAEARIASRAFQLSDTTADELMTPRTEIDAVAIDASFDTLLDAIGKTQHTRLPVYEGTVDSIIGALHVRRVLAYLAARERGQAPAPFDIRAAMDVVLVVPGAKDATEVLDEMRTTGRQIAVVLDEFGGTSGILTLEDLLQAIVGAVRDLDEPASLRASTASDRELVLDGLLRLEEVQELAGLHFDDDDREQADTLGGLIMATLGRMPGVGDEVIVHGQRMIVDEMDGRRVARVRLPRGD